MFSQSLPAIPPFYTSPQPLESVSHWHVGLVAGEDGWRSCPENCNERVKLAQRPLGEALIFLEKWWDGSRGLNGIPSSMHTVFQCMNLSIVVLTLNLGGMKLGDFHWLPGQGKTQLDQPLSASPTSCSSKVNWHPCTSAPMHLSSTICITICIYTYHCISMCIWF